MSNKVVKISDKQTALKVVSDDYEQFQCCSEELKNDWDVVLAAVKNYGLNLEYASSDLQANEEIVNEAINENGEALKFASAKLRAKKSIVLKAVKNNGPAIKYASDELKNDPELVYIAIKNEPEAILCVPEYFKKDKKLHALLGEGGNNSDFLNAMSCSEFFKLWLKDNASRFNYTPIEVEFERDFARYRFENITNAIELTLSGYGDVNLAIYDENLNLLDFLGWLEVSPVKVADNYWACDLCTAFNPTSEENIYIDINHLYSQHLCEERILENCNHLFQPDKFLVYYQHMKFKSIWHVDLQSLNEFDPHDEDILKYHSILSSNSCLI